MNMKRLFILMGSIMLISPPLFAGGQAESGRGSALEDIESGQLISFGAIDAEAYLTEFAFDKKPARGEPLGIWVEPESTLVLNGGETLALRIALRTAGAERFDRAPGSYVLFFQEPGVLRAPAFTESVGRLIEGEPSITFFVYDPHEKSLLETRSAAAFRAAARRLGAGRKRFDNQRLLHELLATVSKDLGGERRHVAWVTDENIVETPQDARMFSFSVNLLGGSGISFSYLGYGEVPSWEILNTSLGVNNGNSYFAGDSYEVVEKLRTDIGYFAVPAVEDVEVSMVWSRHVSLPATFYPPRLYRSVSGFYPKFNNNRPASAHFRGGMNYDETARFIHYVSVPPLLRLLELKEDNPVDRSGRYQVGTVFVRYVLVATGEVRYAEEPVTIEYTGSLAAASGSVNDFVFADAVIQNTPLVLKEVAALVNKNQNYLTSMELLQCQRRLLESVREVREDAAVEVDIAMLDDTYHLLLEQARTLNLIMTP
ncbi:MAG: hypothetical protein ACOC8N_06175 [Spirochaetota bacterium]